jgi:ribonucleotide reductase beta subunit family protein with ferritin-like domain
MSVPEILAEVQNRFVLFPIRYKSIWEMYKKAVSAFWTPEEIDLSADMADWEKLNKNEQYFIKHVLAFFAGSDGIVNENLSERFIKEVPVQEVKCFYGFQIAMENIHCVSGNTEILTMEGYTPIATKEGKVVSVWNGTEWSKVMVMKTSDKASAYRISLSNGMELTCTPNHEWLIGENKTRVKACDLEVGLAISSFEYPPPMKLSSQELFSNLYDHGNLIVNPDSPYYPMKFNGRPRQYVPINYCMATKIEWLDGLFKNAITTQGGICIKYAMKDNVLRHIQLLLTTLNVHSSTNEGELHISNHELQKLVALDISSLKGQAVATTATEATKITIVDIVALEAKIPMYCFEEPINHTGIFNGILTGQSETYSILLDTYIKNSEEKAHLLNAINTIPCIAQKAEWAMKWITDKSSSFAMRLVAFACIEGIFFSGAFCAIFWLKERGLLPGLCLSNEFISRDESLHTEFACHLYTFLGDTRLDKDIFETIVKEAVEIEDEFINHSIPCNLLGMNQMLMSQYIKFVADRLCVQMGYEKIYNERNPFQFMDRINLSSKTNFFEHTRLSEYSKARVGNNAEENGFGLDADF